MSGLLEWVDSIDKKLFIFVNHDLHTSLLDNIMLLLRNQFTWIPLYLFILIWSYKKIGKPFWLFLILSILTFAITDYASASILKPLIGRLRPCYDETLQNTIHMLVNCGGTNSMPSSHAANHFGLAAFWFWTIWITCGKKWHWLWLWAFIIGYAQVYVGKHYPLDIFVGAIQGYIIGTLTAKAFELWYAPKRQLAVKGFTF